MRADTRQQHTAPLICPTLRYSEKKSNFGQLLRPLSRQQLALPTKRNHRNTDNNNKNNDSINIPEENRPKTSRGIRKRHYAYRLWRKCRRNATDLRGWKKWSVWAAPRVQVTANCFTRPRSPPRTHSLSVCLYGYVLSVCLAASIRTLVSLCLFLHFTLCLSHLIYIFISFTASEYLSSIRHNH